MVPDAPTAVGTDALGLNFGEYLLCTTKAWLKGLIEASWGLNEM